MARVRIGMRRIMRLDDTPHRIALGSAIGTCIAWLPLLGIQIILSAIVARICRASVLASLPWAFITNPFTAVPFYWLHYRLGLLLMPGCEAVGWDRFRAIFAKADAATYPDPIEAFWHRLTDGFVLLGDVLLPTTVGTLVVGLPVSALVYRLVRARVEAVQRRRSTRIRC